MTVLGQNIRWTGIRSNFGSEDGERFENSTEIEGIFEQQKPTNFRLVSVKYW